MSGWLESSGELENLFSAGGGIWEKEIKINLGLWHINQIWNTPG